MSEEEFTTAPNIRNETTARWTLYLELQVLLIVFMAFVFIYVLCKLVFGLSFLDVNRRGGGRFCRT